MYSSASSVRNVKAHIAMRESLFLYVCLDMYSEPLDFAFDSFV